MKRVVSKREKFPIFKQTLSKNLYSRYYTNIMVDGVGVRNSLYVTGCLFACKGCYNKSIQNFNNGEPFTKEMQEKVVKDLEPKHIDGLTLLGGEPLLNLNILLPLVRDVRDTYGWDKTIWSWTGFTWEEILTIMEMEDNEDADKIREYIHNIDILVDGRFELDNFKSGLSFRGSTNQKIIDVQKTLQSNEIVLWKNGEYK